MNVRTTITTMMAAVTLSAIAHPVPALADGAKAIEATLDSGTMASGLGGRESYVVTTQPSAALVRLERAALRGRPIRSLRIDRGDGSAPIELRDVTIAGWSYAEDSANTPDGAPIVDVRLTYDHAR